MDSGNTITSNRISFPPTPAHKKTGRPSDYRLIFNRQAELLCKAGATDSDLCEFFGVTDETLKTWKEKHKEFLAATLTRAQMDEKVVCALYRKAISGDVNACKFWLINRQRQQWADLQKIQHEGEITLSVENKSAEQLRREMILAGELTPDGRLITN